MRFKIVVWIWLITLLAGCVAQLPVEAPATDSATRTPTNSPSATSTVTLTPTPTSTATATPGPSLEELIGTPQYFAANADLDRASVGYSSLADLYPDRADPWLGLAGLAQRQGDTATARQYLEVAIQADPSNVAAYDQLALLLESQGLYEDVLPVYDQVIAAVPPNPDLYIARASAHARLGDADGAVADLQSAQALDPYRQFAWLNVATAASGTRKYAESIQIATAGLEVFPKSVGLHVARGMAHASLEEWELAVEDFTAAIELDPLNYVAYHWRGRALISLGHQEEALVDLKRAGELGIQTGVEGVNEGYEAMADAAALIAETNINDAFQYLADQVIQYGSQDALLVGYARIDYRRGNKDLALGRLYNLVRDGYVPAFYWRAVINAAEDNPETAIDDLTAYLAVRRSGPESEAARRLLASFGVDPDSLDVPTATPTPIIQPGEGEGGD